MRRQMTNEVQRVENPYADEMAQAGGNIDNMLQRSDGLSPEASAKIQEVQAGIFLAKQFPREKFQIMKSIQTQCMSKAFAEDAMYSFPRGGKNVSGLSIRAAEMIANNWGNLNYGWEILSQSTTESQVVAFAWDMQTNTRNQIKFTIKHERKAQGKVRKIEDPRDVAEMIANYGSRYLRTCILRVIPAEVQSTARNQIVATLAGGSEDLSERIPVMIKKFGKLGITVKHLEKRLGHSLETVDQEEMLELIQIFKTLDDNMASASNYFEGFAKETSDSSKELTKQFKKPVEKPAKKAPAEEKKTPKNNQKQQKVFWKEFNKNAKVSLDALTGWLDAGDDKGNNNYTYADSIGISLKEIKDAIDVVYPPVVPEEVKMEVDAPEEPVPSEEEMVVRDVEKIKQFWNEFETYKTEEDVLAWLDAGNPNKWLYAEMIGIPDELLNKKIIGLRG